MNSGFVTCTLIGEDFKVDALGSTETVRLLNKHNKGDIGDFGRYNGVENPYSSVELRSNVEDNERIDEQLNSLLDFLSKNIDRLIECEILVTLNFEFANQGNWEFTRDQLSKIVELNIELSITVFGHEKPAGR